MVHKLANLDELPLSLLQAAIFEGQREDQRDLHCALQKWTRDKGIAQQALRVGDFAPTFVLPDARGHIVSSIDLLKTGPVVINIFAGTWCPFSVAQIRALDEAHERFQTLGASYVCVSPEVSWFANALTQRFALRTRFLSDLDHGVLLLFGLTFVIPPDILGMMDALQIDLRRRYGSEAFLLPLPGTFVIGVDGRIAGAFVASDLAPKVEPRQIIEVLESLRS